MPLTIKGYVDIAIAILVVALIVTCGFLWDRHKLDADKLDKLNGDLSATRGVLAQLQEGQQADSAAIAAVAASQVVNAQHGSVVRQRVITMGQQNDALRKWLDTRIPSDRACLLDDTCAAGQASASSAVAGVASAVY